LAYCDNDCSKQRKNFVDSVAIKGENKNAGYRDANVFGTLTLVSEK
jgi:hypothetical protein